MCLEAVQGKRWSCDPLSGLDFATGNGTSHLFMAMAVAPTNMESPLILVIGNGPSKSPSAVPYWASLAEVLRNCGYNVKETTDVVSEDDGELKPARRWISKNSLRRLEGQGVRVICAMDAQGRCDKSWVDVLDLVFNRQFISVAAVLQDDSLRSTEALQAPLLQNSEVLETVDAACAPDLKRIIEGLKEFKIAIKPLSVDGRSIIKAWSSEKVILFGRTGAGKSTIAQMLTRGSLDPSGGSFKSSSSARGVTSTIERGEGRGWHVTDTPGFGETKEGKVSTKDAQCILTKFVAETCGIYSHYVYVVKKDRINMYDERLWQFFKMIFEDAESNFSVVVTGCTMKLSAEDETYLQKTFEKCKNFIFVNFCEIDSEDAELEEENKEERASSLVELEDGLGRLGVAEEMCAEGQYSKESVRFVTSELGSGIGNYPRLVKGLATGALHYLLVNPVGRVGKFLHKSKIDENLILLPQ